MFCSVSGNTAGGDSNGGRGISAKISIKKKGMMINAVTTERRRRIIRAQFLPLPIM
jgi:hypothetical protein